MVKDVCRSFICTRQEGICRKATGGWDCLVLPATKGGLNLIDMYKWNKASILKHLWNIASKKDNLWSAGFIATI